MRRWQRFLADESGPTMVEYALLVALLVLVSVGTLGTFGGGIKNIYTKIDGSMPDPP